MKPIIIIIMFAGLFAKNPNDIIKPKKDNINIHSNEQKEIEAVLMAKYNSSRRNDFDRS